MGSSGIRHAECGRFNGTILVAGCEVSSEEYLGAGPLRENVELVELVEPALDEICGDPVWHVAT